MNNLKERLSVWGRLMRVDKPIGTLLLLWPTLWALWFASKGRPDWTLVVIFTLGTFLMRSAGCVINDWADRKYDGHVDRTKGRPLVTGEATSKEALLLAAGLCVISLLIALPLNSLALQLTLPALFLATSYPFTKRFLAIPQAYLGLAFSFGIPMAFAAQTGHIPVLAWMLFAGNVLWTIAYDTEYALVDKPDDLKIGIRTSAITFGRFDIAAIMVCYAGFIALIFACGVLADRGRAFVGAMAVLIIAVIDQYRRIKGRDREACFAAFLSNNLLGLLVFAALAIDYWLFP